MGFNDIFHSIIEEKHLNEEVYWVRGIQSVNDIIDNGFITLSPVTQADVDPSGKRHTYFISVSRVPINSFRSGIDGVTMVLDGRIISSRYKVVPINYFNTKYGDGSYGEMRVSHRDYGNNEAEERILSNNAIMPAKNIIKELHLLYEEQYNEQGLYENLTGNSKTGTIDVYFYTDKKSLELLDKRKAIRPEDLDIKSADKPSNAEPQYFIEFENILDDLRSGLQNPNGALAKYKNLGRMQEVASGALRVIGYKRGTAVRYLIRDMRELFDKYDVESIQDLVEKVYEERENKKNDRDRKAYLKKQRKDFEKYGVDNEKDLTQARIDDYEARVEEYLKNKKLT